MATTRRKYTGVGLGTPIIPFDQSRGDEAPMLTPPNPLQQNPLQQTSPPSGVLEGMGQGAGLDLASLTGGEAAASSDALPTEQIEALAPEDMEAQEMIAMLQDPATPPEIRAAIEAELQMAARRALTGGNF